MASNATTILAFVGTMTRPFTLLVWSSRHHFHHCLFVCSRSSLRYWSRGSAKNPYDRRCTGCPDISSGRSISILHRFRMGRMTIESHRSRGVANKACGESAQRVSVYRNKPTRLRTFLIPVGKIKRLVSRSKAHTAPGLKTETNNLSSASSGFGRGLSGGSTANFTSGNSVRQTVSSSNIVGKIR
jgi:hypothetical protein